MSRTARKDENASENYCWPCPIPIAQASVGSTRPRAPAEAGRISHAGQSHDRALQSAWPSACIPPRTRDNLVGLPGPGKRTFPSCNVKKGPHVPEPNTPAGVCSRFTLDLGLCQFPQNSEHHDWLPIFCPRHLQDAGVFLLTRLCPYPPLLLLLCPAVLCVGLLFLLLLSSLSFPSDACIVLSMLVVQCCSLSRRYHLADDPEKTSRPSPPSKHTSCVYSQPFPSPARSLDT